MVSGESSNPKAGEPASDGQQGHSQNSAQRPFDSRLEEIWSVTLPAWLDDWSSQVAQGLADGAWTAAWRGVASFVPLVAFVLGLASRLIFRDLNVVYTESLAFMLVVVAGSILSGPVGVMLLAGYIVEDLLVGNKVGPTLGGANLTPNPAGVLAGKLVSYLLLAMPAIVLPMLARQLSGAVSLRSIADARVRLAALAALDAAICGTLIFLWSQSMLVLIRPLFSLVGSDLTSDAATPLQEQSIWLVVAAGMAGALRVLLVQLVVPRSPRAGLVTDLERRRWAGDKRGVLERIPKSVRVAIAAAVVTLVLTGTYDGWLDAIIAAIVIGVLALWQANLVHRIPVPMKWALSVRKVPPLIRLLGAIFIGYLLSALLLAPLWNAFGGVRLLMVGSLLSLLVFNLLFPPLPVGQEEGQGSGARQI